MKKIGLVEIFDRWRKLGGNNRFVFCVDSVLVFFSVWLAYSVRLSIAFHESYLGSMLAASVVFWGCLMVPFYFFGVYRIYWPQASLEELFVLCRSYAVGCLAFVVLVTIFNNMFFLLPRSSLLIALFAGIILLGMVRLSWRPFSVSRPESSQRALIIGAGDVGATLVRDLLRYGGDIQPVGFLDDSVSKKGKLVAGLEVLGGVDSIPEFVEKLDANVILIDASLAKPEILGKIYTWVGARGINVRILPSLANLADGRVSVSMLRPVSLEDLLARDQVELDSQGIANLVNGKVVMVTGAGGSIGSELARQLLDYGPEKIVLLGHGEYSIYSLIESLGDRYPYTHVIPVIADVESYDIMDSVFGKWKPSLVFHAAAHKHVPLMEDNPHEALRVNSRGTWTLGELCGKHGVERMVLVSTDKAVNPTSVMGATKRLAEMVLLGLQKGYPETKYMAVRFGNVLGSRGSVVPKFEEQIARGGPVTVTHPDMERYFMLIPEAAGLVIQAATLGMGGEIFVLDMGEPIKIVDLANTLIRLHGYTPEKDIAVNFSGIRPGEKLFEELFYDPSFVDETAHVKIFCSKMGDGAAVVSVDDLNFIMGSGDVVGAITSFVPEYSPNKGA